MTRFQRQEDFQVGDIVIVDIDNADALNDINLYYRDFHYGNFGKIISIEPKYIECFGKNSIFVPKDDTCYVVRSISSGYSWEWTIPKCILKKR